MSRTQLSLREVSFSHEHRPVLDTVSVAFPPGTVSGLIGENGSGKSTILRLLAGRLRPDRGEVRAVAPGGLGLLAQDHPLPDDWTVRGAVDDALAPIRTLEARLREIERRLAGTPDDTALLTDYGTTATTFELRGGYDAEHRVGEAFAALGLSDLSSGRRLGELSGGQRARLHLAALLVGAPEVLLLDEPTNHLDDAAVAWLEARLRVRHGTTVVATHDRVLLDRVTTTLVEVDGDTHRVRRHPGSYDDHRAARTAERARWRQARADWEREVAEQREAAATTARRVAPGRARTDGDKMSYDRHGERAQASLAGRVRAARERLRRLLDDPVPVPPDPVRFTARPVRASTATGPVLAARGAGVAGRLDPVDLTVTAGDRLLVTGANAGGKSTLLAMLAGELAPSRGTVSRRGRVGHLPQEPAAPRDRTVLDAFARDRPGSGEEHAAELRSLGLFAAEDLTRRVGALSTGGRRRVDLARLVADPYDVLLLDEPTNHLALGLVEELEAALADYPGAVVVVSHDRRLRSAWPGVTRDLGELTRARPT